MKKYRWIIGWIGLGLLWWWTNQQAFVYDRHIVSPIGAVLPYQLTVDYYEQHYHLRDPEGMYAVIYSGEDFPTGTVPEGHETLKKVILQELYWDHETLVAGLMRGDSTLLYLSIDAYEQEAYVPAYTLVTVTQAEQLPHHANLYHPPFWIKHWRWLGCLIAFLWLGLGYWGFRQK